MPDLAKCYGEDGERICPLRYTCYRFLSKPSGERQPYVFGMDGLEGDKCSFHLPAESTFRF